MSLVKAVEPQTVLNVGFTIPEREGSHGPTHAAPVFRVVAMMARSNSHAYFVIVGLLFGLG